MASVRKHPKSPYWIICFTKPNGTRTTRTTKIPVAAPNREVAKEQKEKALEIAKKVERAGRQAKRDGMTPERARGLMNDILRSAGVEEVDAIITRAYLATWISGKDGEGTNERYQHVANLFLQHLKKKADGPLSAITYQDVLSWMEARKKERIASKTRLVDAKILNNAFRLAVRLGHIPKNPVEQALAIQPIKAQSSTKGTFTIEQIALLILAAQGEWKSVVYLGYYTGARLRDCTNVRMSQINFRNNTIMIRHGKTGKLVVTPMHKDLRGHLETRCKGLKGDDFVNPSLANRKTGGKTGLSRQFADIMKLAAIDQQIQPGQGKRKFSKLSFHSFRHTFNSHMADENVDQEVRMELTGQSRIETNEIYTHREIKKLQEAIDVLPSVSAALKTTEAADRLKEAA